MRLRGRFNPPIPQSSCSTNWRGVLKVLSGLRYRQLALLVALDQHRNLHRAATAVNLAQPSASNALANLESLFGCALFDRSPTGMQPTKVGARVLRFARRAIADLENLASDLENRRASAPAQLTIGTCLDLVPDFVTRALCQLRLKSILTVKLYRCAPHKVADQLMAGDTDAVIGYIAAPINTAEIQYESLLREPLCVVARRDHPLANTWELNPQELSKSSWITHSMTYLAEEAINQFSPFDVINSDSLAVTLNLLAQSDAVTILPESVIAGYLRAGVLTRLPLILGVDLVEFGIATRRHAKLSPATLTFRALLRAGGECT